MSSLTDPRFHEAFELWPTWQSLVDAVSSSEADRADPPSIFGAACGFDLERLAALVFWNGTGASFDDAKALLGEVLALARNGRRPRYAVELGLDIGVITDFLTGDDS